MLFDDAQNLVISLGNSDEALPKGGERAGWPLSSLVFESSQFFL